MADIKVMLVDDHTLVRNGLKAYLDKSEGIKVVATAEHGQDCLDQLPDLEVDILLTDMNMPEMDGLTLAKEVRDAYPDLKVVALTMMGESQHIKQMLAEGAMGYLLKNADEEEVRLAIKNVYDGGTYYSPQVTNIIMNNVRRVKPLKSNVVVEMRISEREKEVLHLILKEYSNQEIADELFIGLRTVEAHKRNLLDKTGSKNIAGLVLYAIDKQLFDDI